MSDEDVLLAPHRDRSAEWLHECREEWFLALGFTEMQAAVLADVAADHHEAEKLLKRNCPIEIAFDLLT